MGMEWVEILILFSIMEDYVMKENLTIEKVPDMHYLINMYNLPLKEMSVLLDIVQMEVVEMPIYFIIVVEITLIILQDVKKVFTVL